MRLKSPLLENNTMGFFDTLIGKKESKSENRIQSILPQEIFEAGVLELKDLIAPSALKVTPRELDLGEKILRSFFVISYPHFLSEEWFSPILNMDKVFDLMERTPWLLQPAPDRVSPEDVP